MDRDPVAVDSPLIGASQAYSDGWTGRNPCLGRDIVVAMSALL